MSIPAPLASAQTGDANAEARVFFQRGNRLAERARRSRGARRTELFEQALEAYVNTIQIVPSRNAIFNAGYVLEELERYADAFAYYQRYLGIEGLTEDERLSGGERVDAIRPHVAIVQVQSEPSGASVFVDRLDLAARGTTPLLMALSAGDHTVILRAPHHADLRRPVSAVLGQSAEVSGSLVPNPVVVTFEVIGAPDATVEVGGQAAQGGSLSLVPGAHTARVQTGGRETVERAFEVPIGPAHRVRLAPGAAQAAIAHLTVRAPEAAEVLLDGMPVAQGEVSNLEIAPGSHRVTVRAPGRAELEQVVVVMAGQHATLHAELGEGGGRRFGPLPHILLGFTVVSAGVFSGLAIKAGSESDELAEMEGEPLNDIIDQEGIVRDWNRRADAVLGVAAAGAIATLVFYILNRPREGLSRGRVELSAGATHEAASVGLRGSF